MNVYVARVCTSFIDVPGKIAVALYFAGCSLRCKDCQNKELWSRAAGECLSIDEIVKKIGEHELSDSVVFLGGEPTDQIEALSCICSRIIDKEKVLYTGREFEVLPESLCADLDMVICGPYRSDLHVGGWPASSNQRVFKKKGKLWQHVNS